MCNLSYDKIYPNRVVSSFQNDKNSRAVRHTVPGGGKRNKKKTKKQTTFDVCLNTAFPLFFHRLIVKMLCLELLRASSCKLVTVGGLQIHEEHKLCVLKIRFYYYLLLFIYLEV